LTLGYFALGAAMLGVCLFPRVHGPLCCRAARGAKIRTAFVIFGGERNWSQALQRWLAGSGGLIPVDPE